MHEVTVTCVVEPEPDEVLRNLSPRRLVEYAEMYDIEACDRASGAKRITVSFEGELLELEFTELENGYEYTLVESSGLFANRDWELVVNDSEKTEVVARSQYTLNSMWSLILDRLATGTIQQELETTIENLVVEVVEEA
jgi:hypothetical protein